MINTGHTVETITIVGGGWSVRNIVLDEIHGLVIAVNEAAILLPRVDIVISMDRLWTEHRWQQLVKRGGPTWLRRSAVQNVAERWESLVIFDCDHLTNTFTNEYQRLNGTNSGACAMNLAFRFRPRRLFLLGFDMNRDSKRRAYWHKPYSWSKPNGGTGDKRYREWSTQFEEAATSFKSIDTQVFNVSPTSAITSFTKITPQEYGRLA